MNEPTKSRDVSALIALVNAMIEYWKEIARRNFVLKRHAAFAQIIYQDAPVCDIDTRDLRHANSHIALFPEQMANRRGDVARRQHGSRDLIEQRLKEMVIRAVNQRHANRRVSQGAGGGQSSETAADDHHMRQLTLRHDLRSSAVSSPPLTD